MKNFKLLVINPSVSLFLLLLKTTVQRIGNTL